MLSRYVHLQNSIYISTLCHHAVQQIWLYINLQWFWKCALDSKFNIILFYNILEMLFLRLPYNIIFGYFYQWECVRGCSRLTSFSRLIKRQYVNTNGKFCLMQLTFSIARNHWWEHRITYGCRLLHLRSHLELGNDVVLNLGS